MFPIRIKPSGSLLLAFLLTFGSASAQAQSAPKAPASSSAAAARQMPRGKMYGRLVDGKTGKATGEAFVSLLQTRSGKKVLVAGQASTANGEFSLENLPMMAQMELVVNAPGYKEYHQPVAFDMAALMKAGAAMRGGSAGESGGMPDGSAALLAAMNKDLGNIRLEQSEQSLKEVTVSAALPMFSLQGEKKIFNVEKNLTSQGGTAADVMKNVPGVLVDADNKITLRNSAPQILVDGRQTPLQLDQIPADAISSIEIITNSSAKFDAEGGTGGVLNIVLKKSRRQGYNGSVRASADSHGGGSLGGDFSMRSGKFNLSFTGQSMMNHSIATATTDRTDYYSMPGVHTFQDEKNSTAGGFGFGWLGLDYFITNRTTISVAGMKMLASSRPDDKINVTTDSLFDAGATTNWALRSSGGKNTFDMTSAQMNIKHLFPRAGREWTLDADMNSGRSTYDSRYVETPYQTSEHSGAGNAAQSQTAGNGTNKILVVQSDYSTPVADRGKVDLGVKTTIRQVENNLSNSYYDASAGEFIEVVNPGSDFKSHDAVYAAYGSYSGNIDANNAFQLGLRAESSRYTGTLSKLDSSFSIQYPVSLFPSVFYTRKMKYDQQLQLSYRRGINRPNFFQLLPYTDFTDPLNIRQGNPALRPEFTNSIELSYMKNFTRNNYVLLSVYERHADNLITGFQSLGINPFTSEPAIINSYVNASTSDKYGFELTSGWDLKKWWTINADVNAYNGKLSSAAGSSSYLSGFGKLNNQFRFGKGWSGQLSAVVQSRTNLLPDTKNQGYSGMGRGITAPQSSANAQGYLGGQWYADAAIRKSFLKNDVASLSLSVSDIFGTRKYIQYSESDLFVQDYRRLVNPSLFRLSFNWRFGKMDMDLFRRKNVRGQMEGMQDASQSMGM